MPQNTCWVVCIYIYICMYHWYDRIFLEERVLLVRLSGPVKYDDKLTDIWLQWREISVCGICTIAVHNRRRHYSQANQCVINTLVSLGCLVNVAFSLVSLGCLVNVAFSLVSLGCLVNVAFSLVSLGCLVNVAFSLVSLGCLVNVSLTHWSLLVAW